MKVKTNAMIFFMLIIFLLFGVDISFAEEGTSTVDTNIVSQIVTEFKEQTDKWYDKLTSVATNLFFLVITFELLWTSTKAAIQQMEVKDYLINFTMITVSGIFFLAVINNYQEWTSYIIFGLQKVAGSLVPTHVNSDNPFLIALDFFVIVEKQLKALDWTAVAMALGLLLTGLIICICFALITAKMIVIKCEVMVGLLAGLLLIPLGASQMFREYAINVMRYAVSVAFKLFTMQLIIAVGYGFMDKLTNGFEAKFNVMFVCIAFSLILVCIIFTLPDTIASLVSNAHGSSGNMLHALSTVANAATAAAAGAMAIASVPGKTVMGAIDATRQGKELQETFNEARSGNFWDTSKNLAGAGLALRDQAKLNNSSIGRELLNRHNSRKIISS